MVNLNQLTAWFLVKQSSIYPKYLRRFSIASNRPKSAGWHMPHLFAASKVHDMVTSPENLPTEVFATAVGKIGERPVDPQDLNEKKHRHLGDGWANVTTSPCWVSN